MSAIATKGDPGTIYPDRVRAAIARATAGESLLVPPLCTRSAAIYKVAQVAPVGVLRVTAPFGRRWIGSDL